MAIVVYSPHNGRPVKVREEDVGRAVRDSDGRIFYVLARGDGKGPYGATTRAGGPKEEQRALELEAKAKTEAQTAGPGEDVTPVYDATGKGRPAGEHMRRVLVILFLLLILLLLVWLFTFGPLGRWGKPAVPAATPTAAVQADGRAAQREALASNLERSGGRWARATRCTIP